MRLAIAACVLSLGVIGCGDDDSSGARDAGYRIRDAGPEQCLPYYLSQADRGNATDGGSDADAATADAAVVDLACELRPGDADSECDDIPWSFAGGEQLTLTGCCGHDGQCGGIDPTGVLGCVPRAVFGRANTSCTVDDTMDSGVADAQDDDASAI